MAGINWAGIGANISGLTTMLTSLGVNQTGQTTILTQLGALLNPNQAQELAISSQILMFASTNPALVAQLGVKLATEQGIPPAAAQLAMTLASPGVDIPARVLQIETIIKNGG